MVSVVDVLFCDREFNGLGWEGVRLFAELEQSGHRRLEMEGYAERAGQRSPPNVWAPEPLVHRLCRLNKWGGRHRLEGVH
jgi:uncharacterized membrane-anchored protein